MATNLPGGVEITLPFEGTVFPPDIAPPTFFWESNKQAKDWHIILSDKNKKIHFIQLVLHNNWQPDELLWEKIKKIGTEDKVHFFILGVKRGQIIASGNISFSTSEDSVAAPIFYRAVPLPFEYAIKNFDEIRWHLGDIGYSHPSPVLFANLPLCGNCHSFSKDGTTLAMDVDYANDKGSYVISEIKDETILTPDKIITWSDYLPENKEQTFGLLSQISPSGRYVASTVKDRSIFVATPGLSYSQLFFPIKGIIAIYDRKTGQFSPLQGADDPEYVQSNPCWSSDGETIYFAKAKAYRSEAVEKSQEVILPIELAQEFIDGKREFKYDIYRIPFNNGKGGTAEPVKGASKNGKSNYFPRMSPDGKWIVFCQAENFMLLQPDSKLYILPSQGGEAQMLSCNSDSMNSWHSWSPNSRWLVYSTKVRSAYTELLITHIDESGHSSPPVLLDNFSFEDRAINIPEFINLKNRKWLKIVDNFSNQAHYYFTIGRSKAGESKIPEAIEAFNKSIELDSTYGKSYVFRGHIEFANNMLDQALISYEQASKYIKDDPSLYENLGNTRYKLRSYDAAITAFDRAIHLLPTADAFFGRGLAFAKKDNLAKAIKDFSKAIDLDSTDAKVYHERGICYALTNKLNLAVADLKKASQIEPDNVATLEKLGSCYYQLGHYGKAADSYSLALSLQPNDGRLLQNRGDCKYKSGDLNEALTDYSAAIDLNPRAGLLYYRRGVVYIELGDKEKGCNDLNSAKDLGISQAQELIKKHCLS